MPMASTAMASMVAERVRVALESHMFPVRTGRTTDVKISTGVSCFPTDGETTEELLTVAARNMQLDKHTRKLIPSLGEASNVASIDAFR
jgi:GGDEF domain-containing protein